jgi:hypothetical protein
MVTWTVIWTVDVDMVMDMDMDMGMGMGMRMRMYMGMGMDLLVQSDLELISLSSMRRHELRETVTFSEPPKKDPDLYN